MQNIILVKKLCNFMFRSSTKIPRTISKGSKLLTLFQIYVKFQKYVIMSYLQVI